MFLIFFRIKDKSQAYWYLVSGIKLLCMCENGAFAKAPLLWNICVCASRFLKSGRLWVFPLSFPFFLPFPETDLQISADPPGGAQREANDYTWNWKDDLNFPQAKKRKSISAERGCEKEEKPERACHVTQWQYAHHMTDGMEKVGWGQHSKGDKIVKNLLFQSVDSLPRQQRTMETTKKGRVTGSS